MHSKSAYWDTPLSGQTDACENITFPLTFAGGKYYGLNRQDEFKCYVSLGINIPENHYRISFSYHLKIELYIVQKFVRDLEAMLAAKRSAGVALRGEA